MPNRGVLLLSLSMLTVPLTDAGVGGAARVLRIDDFEDGDRQLLGAVRGGSDWTSIDIPFASLKPPRAGGPPLGVAAVMA